MTSEKFKELFRLDIKQFTEEKMNLTYLNWAQAVRLAKEHDPDFTYKFVENAAGGYEFPGGTGWLVKTECTFKGLTLPMTLAIMGLKNESKKIVDARDIADSLVRCLVKNIAVVSGIGLALYAKEDIEQFVAKTEEDEVRDNIQELLNNHKTVEAFGDEYKACIKEFGIPSKLTDISKLRAFYDRVVSKARELKLI
ncbi:MAG: DUF1071 domain-containing protein [Cetobacterium sp.]|uniref:Sak single strand annealing protein n=1 Tax=Cetobacterium sp. TaxID=2071632 RepID=UPI003EE66440